LSPRYPGSKVQGPEAGTPIDSKQADQHEMYMMSNQKLSQVLDWDSSQENKLYDEGLERTNADIITVKLERNLGVQKQKLLQGQHNLHQAHTRDSLEALRDRLEQINDNKVLIDVGKHMVDEPDKII